MACPTFRCGRALVYGQPSCVWSWWPQMLAPWSATSPDSQRRPLLHSSASSSSTKLWRSSFTWENTTLSTCTTTWRTLHCIREYLYFIQIVLLCLSLVSVLILIFLQYFCAGCFIIIVHVIACIKVYMDLFCIGGSGSSKCEKTRTFVVDAHQARCEQSYCR